MSSLTNTHNQEKVKYMKRKPQLISILLVVASFLFSNFGIGFLPAMASNHIGSSMSVPVVRPSNKVVVNPNGTQLTEFPIDRI